VISSGRSSDCDVVASAAAAIEMERFVDINETEHIKTAVKVVNEFFTHKSSPE
jgi:AMMECR1 domain-containing protein